MNLSVPTKQLWFWASLIALALVGAASFSQYNLAPAASSLELALPLSIILLPKSLSKTDLIISLTLFAFLTFRWLGSAAFVSAHTSDFLIAHKFLLYLIALNIFRRRQAELSKKSLLNISSFILLIFLFKYAAWRLLVGPRPGLFMENNFELLLPIFLAVCSNERFERIPRHLLILLLTIFILSGSRSGIAALIGTLGVLYARPTKTGIKYGLILLSLGVTFIGANASRIVENYTKIDRFKFLEDFLISMHGASPLRWIFGPVFFHPVPQFVCSKLSFYSQLFSIHKSGECYSVIFHAFILRSLFDFGILPTIVFFLLCYRFFRSRLSQRGSIAITTALILNAMSVSSINSSFFFIGCLVVMFSVPYRHRDSSVGVTSLTALGSSRTDGTLQQRNTVF